MRTIIAISLLILLAAVACGEEAPEPVATTEPTTTPASLLPTNTPFSPTAEPTATPEATNATMPSTPTPTPTVDEVTNTPTPTATPEPTAEVDRAALLSQVGTVAGGALAKREWALLRSFYPDEYKAKCSLEDFAVLLTFAWSFWGIPEGASYVLDGVRIDGDNGWTDSHWEKDGVSFDLDDDESVTDEEPGWVWQDSKWVVYVSPEVLGEENPCSLEFTTPEPTATPEPTNATTTWRGLVLAPEDRCSSYDPDDYPYSQSVEAQIVADIGGIYGPYTGRWFASQKDTDIEHIVARSEAHDSGLCAANDATRREFAADLLNLTLAGPTVNRHQKSGKDAAEWLPDMNKCWFADRSVQVRLKYELTVDQAEADALGLVLTGCSSVEMVVVSATELVTPTPTPGADVDALALWDDNGNGRITCDEARDHGIAPVRRGHPAYQYMRDADDDGIVCE